MYTSFGKSFAEGLYVGSGNDVCDWFVAHINPVISGARRGEDRRSSATKNNTNFHMFICSNSQFYDNLKANFMISQVAWKETDGTLFW